MHTEDSDLVGGGGGLLMFENEQGEKLAYSMLTVCGEKRENRQGRLGAALAPISWWRKDGWRKRLMG